MGAVTIQQMADRVAELMELRLRARGSGLAEKLARGGRALPRRVRAAAGTLAEAAQMAQNPKLLVQIDELRVAAAYDICLHYLGPLGRGARRKGAALDILATMAFSLVVVAALVIGVLVWRGYL